MFMPIISSIDLPDNEIHLWICQSNNIRAPELLHHYDRLMTDEERAKQLRYRFEKDQHQALVTRALVRTVLSKYAPIAPQDWRFEKGERDKPEIVPPAYCRIPALRFNLSHTYNFITCGVTLEKDLGVDVEHCERTNDVVAIADRYFSPSEVNELFSLPEAKQRSRFFDYWTLKESYIKACGMGLAIPLDDFSFHIINSAPPQISISFAPQRLDTPEHWQFWLMYPNETHRLSVGIRSIEPRPYKLKLFKTIPLLSDSEITLPLLGD